MDVLDYGGSNTDGVDEQTTEFRSLDGLRLRGTLLAPGTSTRNAAVFVHGGGVTRDEGGFFTRLAAGLARVGIPSLRFDYRAHGESEGDQRELTLSGIVNDIRAAADHAQATLATGPVHLLGASFGGGVSAYFAATYPERVLSLVLVNPLLDYKKRIIEEKPYWANDYIGDEAGRELMENGFIPHSPSFKLGRPLLNEVFYLAPHQVLGNIVAPTLIVHGTGDTFIPVDSSRRHIQKIQGDSTLLEVEGAQHGIAVQDDPGYREAQTQEWQAYVIDSVAKWMTDRN